MANIEKEIWKDINGFEGVYQVSNFGNIKGLERKVRVIRYGKTYFRTENERLMVLSDNSNGYACISLIRGKKFMVHRLVAEAFIKNHQNKPHINHIDANKKNNHVDNLEWVTRSENTLHAIRIGAFPIRAGSSHPNSKKVIDSKTGETYINLVEAAKKTGIGYANLSKMLSGKCRNRTSLYYA